MSHVENMMYHLPESIEIDSWVVQDRSNPNSGFIPVPFTLHLTDVDSDGKFDLRPTTHYEGDWYMYYEEKGGDIMGGGTYWKNNGNGFDRIEDIFQE